MLTQKQGERVIGLCLLVIALLAGYAAWRMPMGTVALPGSGAFPLGISAVLFVVGLWLALPFRDVTPAEGDGNERVSLVHRNIGITFLVIIGAGLLIERAGFILTAFLFLLILLKAYARIGWIVAGLAAIVAAVACYFIFRFALGVPLPLGIFR